MKRLHQHEVPNVESYTTSVAFSATRRMKEQVDFLATRGGVTRSSYLRSIIQEFLNTKTEELRRR